MTKKAIVGLTGMVLLAASSMGTAGAEETPRRGGVFSYAVTLGEPETYDCHAATTVATLYRLAPHYSTLLKIDGDHYPDIVGDVAESWEVSPDGKTYQFRLRPGVRFHDGSPLTATDVKVTYDRIRNPPDGAVSVRSSQLRDVERIDTPDDRTVVFTLSNPNASMPTLFASPWNCLYSAKKLAEEPRFYDRNILGTGPFRLVKHEAGSSWQAERFDGYFRPGLPYLDGLRILTMSPPAAVNALSAGQIMASFPGQSTAEIGRIANARGDKVKVYDPVTTLVMFTSTFNTTRKPFDDPRVRRALNIAIDRRAGSEALSKIITASAFGSFMREGSQFALPAERLKTLPGFVEDMAANRAEAKRLLAEAGVKDLKLVYLNRPAYAALGVFLIDQWRQIGVTAKQDLLENQRFFEASYAGNFDIALDAIPEYADDPTLQLGRFVSYSKNPANLARTENPEFDALYEQQKRTADPAARVEVVHRIEQVLLEQAYTIPLFWSRRYIVMAAEVQGATVPKVPSNYVGLDQAGVWLRQ